MGSALRREGPSATADGSDKACSRTGLKACVTMKISPVAALCGAICVAAATQVRGPSVTPQPIGPYALLSGADSMTVYWTPTATLVKYGILNRLDSTVA